MNEIEPWMLKVAESIQRVDIIRLVDASNVNIARDLIAPHAPKIKPLLFVDGICDTPFGRYKIWESEHSTNDWRASFTGLTPFTKLEKWFGQQESDVVLAANNHCKDLILSFFDINNT